MKVGMLTFHSAINYGAVLQTYALQNKIGSLGYEVEVIDYKNDSIRKSDKGFNLSKINSIRSLVSMIIYYPLRKKRINIFRKFSQDMLKISSQEYNSKNINHTHTQYETICVGSDQVWNYDLTNQDSTYLLSFANESVNKISYAASLGYEKIPKEYVDIYKTYINKFDSISLRESQGKEALEEIVSLDMSVVVDPTLLLNRNEWKKLSENITNPNKDYILVYVMHMSNSLFAFAENLSKKTGCKIVFITDSYKKRVEAKCVRDATPNYFIKLFLDAKYIVTNSFHGLAFSVNLNKNFYVELLPHPSKVNSRLTSLLNLTDLADRIISKPEDVDIDSKIDWIQVNGKLEAMRKESMDYLEKALSKEIK